MKKLAALLVLALAALTLVACGGSSNSSTSEESEASGGGAAETSEKAGGEEKSGGGGGSVVELEADPSGGLAYTTTEASAKTGEVTIDFTNPQGLTHDVAIENEAGETVGQTELIGEGETSETINLKPGTYKYFCTVPGHREAGMEGTLVVK